MGATDKLIGVAAGLLISAVTIKTGFVIGEAIADRLPEPKIRNPPRPNTQPSGYEGTGYVPDWHLTDGDGRGPAGIGISPKASDSQTSSSQASAPKGWYVPSWELPDKK